MRGRWAPPPMEGKGPREGQRMAIGHQAPPSADENNTKRRHAKPPLPHASCAAPADAVRHAGGFADRHWGRAGPSGGGGCAPIRAWTASPSASPCSLHL